MDVRNRPSPTAQKHDLYCPRICVIGGYYTWLFGNSMSVFVIYSLSAGAKKATRESVVINFCRKLTPSYRIQVGQAFFFLLLLSPAGCRQSFPPAMVINSAEGCILPLWLWVSESCWSQRLMTDVHVQSMLHVNMSHSSAAMGLSSSSHIYSLLWPPSESSSYPANSRTQRRLERNNQPYYLSKKCCENYGIVLGFALWPVICDSAKPVNVYLLKRGST